MVRMRKNNVAHCRSGNVWWQRECCEGWMGRKEREWVQSNLSNATDVYNDGDKRDLLVVLVMLISTKTVLLAEFTFDKRCYNKS
jgi:hypothetical protein